MWGSSVQDVVGPDGAAERRRPQPGDMRWDGTLWRRWSGKQWARAAYSRRPERLRDSAPLHADPAIDEARRARALALAVEDQVAGNGATVVHEGPSGVVMAYRRSVSHGLHAVLTVLTGGLWAAVWLYCALSRGDDRVRLEVDPWGNVWARPTTSP